jgi:putative DNA primase/helicase
MTPKPGVGVKLPQLPRTIPAPSEPMAVAREIVQTLYLTPHGPSLRYHRGLPHIWDGTCWPEIAARDVRSAAYHLLENAEYIHPKRGREPWAPTRRKLDDVMDALQAVTLVETRLEPPLWLDRAPAPTPANEIVSMQNGLLHVPTRTLLPHTSRFFVHHSLPFGFLRDTPAPRGWLALMSQLWPDDESSVSGLQEAMGYLLAGGTNLQKIFLMVGPKRAGKGTIARVLTGLLGAHNVAAPTLSSLATNFGLSPLIGKPLAVVADARLSPRTESHVVVERLLSMSGEDSLTVDRKYRDPWTGRLPTRFLILTNELPRLTDSSGALPSRFVVFVLTKSFYGSENPRLTEELIAEAPSIFMWALTGLDRLLERGHFEQAPASREALQRLDDLASPIGAFLRDQCVVSATARAAADDVWNAWRSWCELENRYPGSRALFGRDLHSAVPTIHRVRARSGEERRYDYAGIGLTASAMGSDREPGPPGPIDGGGPGGPRSSGLRVSHDVDPEVTDGRF